MTYATAVMIKKIAVDYGPAIFTLISTLLKAEKTKMEKEDFIDQIVKRIKDNGR